MQYLGWRVDEQARPLILRSSGLRMSGILNINKPAGWTSRDVVNRVQRLVRPVKAGHAGTLDPLATGVLVVCLGQATRLISYVQQMPKSYSATFLLGRTSASDDTETEQTEVAGAPVPSPAEIEAQLPQFRGKIQQRPPAYSALKVNGQRAYKLARRGETVTLQPREVTIHHLTVRRYQYPELELTMQCSSGTYVRSVGRDLAESLGTGAVMSALTRTAIGDFSIDSAMGVDQLDAKSVMARQVPSIAAVARLPRVILTETQITEVRHGRFIPIGETGVTSLQPEEVFAAVTAQEELIALLKEKRPGLFGAACNFTSN